MRVMLCSVVLFILLSNDITWISSVLLPGFHLVANRDNSSVFTYQTFVLVPGPMEELHSLDPRRQELLEARFTGAVSGNTGGSTGSTSGGAKVTAARRKNSSLHFEKCHAHQELHEITLPVMPSCPLTVQDWKTKLFLRARASWQIDFNTRCWSQTLSHQDW